MDGLLEMLVANKRASMAILVPVLALALAQCLGAQSPKPYDPSDSKVDPLECTTMKLKKDIAVKLQVIHEPSIMGNRFLVVLRYREGGDEEQFDPALMPGYRNVSLVSEMGPGKDVPLVVYRRYCVVEIWKFYPENRIKVCHLWVIGDKETSMKLLVENFDRRFLSERQIALSDTQAAQLRSFYARLLGIFMERLKNPPSST